MLNKFLYEIDDADRKIIIGLVEDDEQQDELDNSFSMQNYATYKPEGTQKAIINKGDQVYSYIDTDNGRMYLDVNMYQNKITVQMTENIEHACCYSKDMAEAILFNMNYFGYDDACFAPSGFYKPNHGDLKDSFDNMFRRAVEGSYIQIRKDGTSNFVSYDFETRKYSLVSDIQFASKIKKKNIRKILTINGFIDKDTDPKALCFSPNETFGYETGYYYKGIRINYADGLLSFTQNETATPNDHLINSEEVKTKMELIYNEMQRNDNSEEFYALANNLYVSFDGTNYSFTSDAKSAFKMSNLTFDLLSNAYYLFDKRIVLNKMDLNVIYLNEISENTYEFSNSPLSDGSKSKLIEKANYQAYQNEFANIDNEEGIIAIIDGMYLNLTVDGDSFLIGYSDTGYNATILTDAQAEVISTILNIKIVKREIKNILSAEIFKNYRMDYNDNQMAIADAYEEITNLIISHKHRIFSYEDFSQIKTETEKGSLEYLRQIMPKALLDSESLFSDILTNDLNIHHILIVGSGANLDLIALNTVMKKLKREIKVSTIDQSKWGYYPSVSLSNVKIQGIYRFEFNNCVKSIMDQFDMILFSRDFKNTDVAPMLKALKGLNKKIVLANMRLCNLEKNTDSFFTYFSSMFPLKRKYINHDENEFSDILSIYDKFSVKMQKTYLVPSGIKMPVIEKKYSYHSIVIQENGNYIDLLNKKE